MLEFELADTVMRAVELDTQIIQLIGQLSSAVLALRCFDLHELGTGRALLEIPACNSVAFKLGAIWISQSNNKSGDQRAKQEREYESSNEAAPFVARPKPN